MVDPESIVRIIDKFMDGLNLEGMGFRKAEAAVEGRPSYDSRRLLKLYLYGSRKKLRSSRKLANKLDDRVEWMNWHTDEYLRQLADMDETVAGIKENEGEPAEVNF